MRDLHARPRPARARRGRRGRRWTPLLERLGGDGARPTSASARRSVIDGECRFDLARTRTETYAAPGRAARRRAGGARAPTSRRRDVSVNAIAVRLPDGDADGRPTARSRTCGPASCASCTTRSFADDPTRLWRVARYAARLGFARRPAHGARWRATRARRGQRRAPRLRAAARAGRARPWPRLRAGRGAQRAGAAGGLRRRAPPRSRRRSRCCPPTAAATCSTLAACTAAMEPGAAAALARPPGVHGRASATSSRPPRAGSTGAPLRAARGPAEIARAARGAPRRGGRAGGRRERAALARRAAPRAARDQRRRPARGRRRAGPGARRAAAARARRQARGPGRAGARRSCAPRSPRELAGSVELSPDVMSDRNAMRWDGAPGHYEVWYVSLTDRGSGAGAWVRLHDARTAAGDARVLAVVHGDDARTASASRASATLPIAALKADAAPVPAPVDDAELSDRGMRRGDRRRALGAALGARRAQRRASSTRCSSARGSRAR